jgi:hypothetical protein
VDGSGNGSFSLIEIIIAKAVLFLVSKGCYKEEIS